jgi:hypothetical protein
LENVTVPDVPLRAEFHEFVTVVPLGRLAVTFQPEIAADADTVTLPTKPPDHELAVEKAAEQPPLPPVVRVVVLVERVVLEVDVLLVLDRVVLEVDELLVLDRVVLEVLVEPLPRPPMLTSPCPPSKTTSEQLKKFSLLSERIHCEKMMCCPLLPDGRLPVQ